MCPVTVSDIKSFVSAAHLIMTESSPNQTLPLDAATLTASDSLRSTNLAEGAS